MERICHKALALDPERRYRTAIELERALRGFLARRRIAAAGLMGLAVLAAWLLAPRSQPRSSVPERMVISPATAVPLRTVSFETEHLRGDAPQSFGPLGLSARAILVGDEVGLTARLDAPAYCYLIALNADGMVQLCSPPKESDPPSRSASISFGPSGTFGLTDGPGLQVFVVVASRKSLPPFARWNGRDGLRQRWSHVAPIGSPASGASKTARSSGSPASPAVSSGDAPNAKPPRPSWRSASISKRSPTSS